METRNPRTPAEWQEAVDWAHTLTLLDSAEQYGLVTGPTINVGRCEQILAAGRRRGFVPRAGAVERCVAALVEGQTR